MRKQCAGWGGISLGIGTVAFAMFSPSSAGCSTNLVVLTHSTVTARGCATYSMIARMGVGLIVLGAVLLLGSFILAVRTRRLVSTESDAADSAEPPSTATATASAVSVPALVDVVGQEAAPEPGRTAAVAPRRRPERVGPIPPGEDGPEADAPARGLPVTLPPGWYGNPNHPDKPVQWWDGTRLTDPPSRTGR